MIEVSKNDMLSNINSSYSRGYYSTSHVTGTLNNINLIHPHS